ncbi:MAG: M1 family metallopeptidase [Gemmatimonadales bacterium]
MIRTGWLLRMAAATGMLTSVAGAQAPTFTRADTLRGTNSAERTWWDVTFYDLHVAIHPADSTLRGWNTITYRVTGRPREMQIDLQVPLRVDSVVQDGRALRFRRDGNAYFVRLQSGQRIGTTRAITVHYGGKPRVAENPPWDGGVIWTRGPDGAIWVSTACQGLGASVWWPTKDTQADEPDSQRVALTVPDSLQAVANGRLRGVERRPDGMTTFEWFVSSPINNYAVSAYVGRYSQINETLQGESGPLSVGLWPLTAHLDPARAQFAQVAPVLRCFERWFGPYPWSRDGYQLVEAPHLGMEHQSAVAYGNGFANGYKGTDLSGTGWGLTWDFIIVHETAHEWFGNSITTRDLADMWVHESFANYAESLFTECLYGPAAGAEYMIGVRTKVENDVPIVAPYGVNAKGSGDMYPKGGNMLHTIRQIIGDDGRWLRILRGLNAEFRHRIVTGKQVQDYISAQAGIRLDKVFEQYLTTTTIPVLEYRLAGPELSFRWADAVPGFDMPVTVRASADSSVRLAPTASWQTVTLPLAHPEDFRVDPNFYVIARRAD